MKTYLLLLLTLACQGCTTLALERRTLDLAESSTEVRYQEVVDNLAIIANNRWTLPAFSSIYAGTSDLSDIATVNLPVVPYRNAALTPLFMGTLDPSVSRAIKNNWTLDPVVVPEKLLAMRCACWCVLDGQLYLDCGHTVHLDYWVEGKPAGYYFNVSDHLLAAIQRPWFHEGKCNHAAYESTCHGKHYYVSKEDTAALSEFTLAVQEIARVQYQGLYYPKAVSRTIKIAQGSDTKDGEDAKGKKGNDPITKGLTDNLKISSISLTVDEHGWVTPGPDKYSNFNPNQPRPRLDNVVTDPNLRSAISNSKTQ